MKKTCFFLIIVAFVVYYSSTRRCSTFECLMETRPKSSVEEKELFKRVLEFPIAFILLDKQKNFVISAEESDYKKVKYIKFAVKDKTYLYSLIDSNNISIIEK